MSYPQRGSPQASAIFSDSGTPNTPASPNADSNTGAQNPTEFMLRGGVRKIILTAPPASATEQSDDTIAPYSRVTISYDLYAVPPEAASGSVKDKSNQKKNNDDSSLEADSSEEDEGSPVAPVTPGSALTRNSSNFDLGEKVESEPGVQLTVGAADNLSAIVPGLEIALLTMKKGEKSRVIIPSVKGFEGHGAGNGAIRGNMLLVYDVTIKSVVHEVPVKKDRSITKFITVPGKPNSAAAPSTSAGGVPLLPYETIAKCKLFDVNPITDKPKNGQEANVLIGISHDPELDVAISSMNIGEFSEISFRGAAEASSRHATRRLVALVSVTYAENPQGFLLADALEQGLQRKNRGNKQFSEHQYEKAVLSYQRALQFLRNENFPGPQGSQLAQQRDDLKAICYGNAAQVCLASSMYQDAVAYASSAIELQPENPKFYFRRSKAFRHLQIFHDAKLDILSAQSHIADDASNENDLEAVRVALEEIVEDETKAKALSGSGHSAQGANISVDSL